ncbi:cysteine protease family protein [Klebsormidium nitens]|uniref:ubiquitinyl hydrolase 1 n=1 Tax=Klebsormidium nitens TaxID=105231 RepID=A0A1Y1IMC5_KLENI|nr:cysteine protease family protein [Klebsormidium nitens]|eukprot:GAQ89268.1 cysteine protease family protein [Klebsormidium nitens]
MYSQNQVASDAALARAVQEEEYRAGRAPKPPPLRQEYADPPSSVPPVQEDTSHFNEWNVVIQNQADTLREQVRKAQEARQRQTDVELARDLQAEELGVVRNDAVHASVEPSERRDLELAQGLQAQELEVAQSSDAPVDLNVLQKLRVNTNPPADHSPSTGSSQQAHANTEIQRVGEGLEGVSTKSEASSVGPGTPVASEVIPPDGFFDGIKTDPKIVPIISPEELEESASFNSGTPSDAEGSPLHDTFTRFDGPVGAKLRHMKSIPHVLRTNSFVPTWDEKSSSEDHELLVDRLKAYGLAERHVAGDGNCQFRALSDQLYHTPDKHEHVRKAVYKQLKYHPQFYEAYVSDEDYKHYFKRLATDGEWGDHITLQAAADRYGLKISLLTTFKDNGFIQIEPRETKSQRVLYLSFWADVHYNSIYPASELPPPGQPKHRNPVQKFLHSVFLE